jgi:rhodanese-related sulfurtransferase
VSRLAAALTVLLALAAPAVAGHPAAPAVLTIDPASLERLAAAGRPLAVIDVRPVAAYARGRLPGARSIPLDTLVPRRDEVPDAGIVVLYGAERVDEAAAAYRYLRAAGRDGVFVLEGGFAGWQARGYGVER